MPRRWWKGGVERLGRRYESGCYDVLQWPTNMPRLFVRKAVFPLRKSRHVSWSGKYFLTAFHDFNRGLFFRFFPVFFFFFYPRPIHTEEMINSPQCVSSRHTLNWPCLGSLNLLVCNPQTCTGEKWTVLGRDVYCIFEQFPCQGWGWHGDAMRCGVTREALVDNETIRHPELQQIDSGAVK